MEAVKAAGAVGEALAAVASLVWEEALAVEEHSQAVVLQKRVQQWLALALL